MSAPQDSQSNLQAGSGATPKGVAPSEIASTDKDALGDRALDGVSGGVLIVKTVPGSYGNPGGVGNGG